MRSLPLAALLGLSLAGCLVGDTGAPGAGGDDDTGGMSGSGSGSDPGSNAPTPRVDITVDKTTMATELKTQNPITVTVTGSGGFSGDVSLAASAVDANEAPLTAWEVDLSTPTVTLGVNGTVTVAAMLKIPAKATSLSGSVKVTATSAAAVGTHAASTAVTALNQVTFSLKVDPDTMLCGYPADAGPANPPALSLGTKVRFFNTGTVNFEIHSGGIISHQGQKPNGEADPVTEPNTAYEQVPTDTGTAVWYCHAPPGNDLKSMNPKFVVQ
jgi:hypothetical protein